MIERPYPVKEPFINQKLLGDEKLSAKGVSHRAQKQLIHDIYYRILEEEELRRDDNVRICSTNHQISTVSTKKVSLSAYDDKRFYLNTFKSIPYGHYRYQSNAEGEKNWREKSSLHGFDDEFVHR